MVLHRSFVLDTVVVAVEPSQDALSASHSCVLRSVRDLTLGSARAASPAAPGASRSRAPAPQLRTCPFPVPSSRLEAAGAAAVAVDRGSDGAVQTAPTAIPKIRSARPRQRWPPRATRPTSTAGSRPPGAADQTLGVAVLPSPESSRAAGVSPAPARNPPPASPLLPPVLRRSHDFGVALEERFGLQEHPVNPACGLHSLASHKGRGWRHGS
jgi:hypothetical protein